MPVEAKRSEFAVVVDREGRAAAGERRPVHFGPEWTAEHLLLLALARCILASLGYHARRADVWLQAGADARGTVTRRDDGSWGFVEIELAVDARLDPAPPDLPELLGRVEHGCFVGASLDPRPTYVWRVNGESVSSRGEPS